jgi:hypothetical protein
MPILASGVMPVNGPNGLLAVEAAFKPGRSTVISGGDFGSGSSIGRRGQIFMLRKHGNQNWGRSGRFPPAMATVFEMQVKQLCLRPDQYVSSAQLRKWCEQNKNQYYIPEWLLKAWNIFVDSDLTGAA